MSQFDNDNHGDYDDDYVIAARSSLSSIDKGCLSCNAP